MSNRFGAVVLLGILNLLTISASAQQQTSSFHSTGDFQEHKFWDRQNKIMFAAHAGLAATADVILIPEIPYDIEKVCEKIQARDKAGQNFSIVVAAEGAYSKADLSGHSAHTMEHRSIRAGSVVERLVQEIHDRTGKECRSLVLGHLQRGGMPTGYDRLLATRFGAAAITAIQEEQWGRMVALQSPHLVTVPIEEVIREEKRVNPSHDVVRAARATGISLGD